MSLVGWRGPGPIFVLICLGWNLISGLCSMQRNINARITLLCASDTKRHTHTWFIGSHWTCASACIVCSMHLSWHFGLISLWIMFAFKIHLRPLYGWMGTRALHTRHTQHIHEHRLYYVPNGWNRMPGRALLSLIHIRKRQTSRTDTDQRALNDQTKLNVRFMWKVHRITLRCFIPSPVRWRSRLMAASKQH